MTDTEILAEIRRKVGDVYFFSLAVVANVLALSQAGGAVGIDVYVANNESMTNAIKLGGPLTPAVGEYVVVGIDHAMLEEIYGNAAVYVQCRAIVPSSSNLKYKARLAPVSADAA